MPLFRKSFAKRWVYLSYFTDELIYQVTDEEEAGIRVIMSTSLLTLKSFKSVMNSDTDVRLISLKEIDLVIYEALYWDYVRYILIRKSSSEQESVNLH